MTQSTDPFTRAVIEPWQWNRFIAQHNVIDWLLELRGLDADGDGPSDFNDGLTVSGATSFTLSASDDFTVSAGGSAAFTVDGGTGGLGVGTLAGHDFTAGRANQVAAFHNRADEDMHFVLRAGLTSQSRAYFRWEDTSGDQQWLTGVNAESSWILYDSSHTVEAHRFECRSNDGRGSQHHTFLSSAVDAPVVINNHPDAKSGTGGLHVYSGGASSVLTHQFSSEGTLLSYGLRVDTTAVPNIFAVIDDTGSVEIGNSLQNGALRIRSTASVSSQMRLDAGTSFSRVWAEGTGSPSLLLDSNGPVLFRPGGGFSAGTAGTFASNGLLTLEAGLTVNYDSGTALTVDSATGLGTFNADVILAAPINTSRTMRLTETQFQGGFLSYDGLNNKLVLGVHNTADSDSANDIEALHLDRANGNLRMSSFVGLAQLTTAERDARAKRPGDITWNSTASKAQVWTGSVWVDLH